MNAGLAVSAPVLEQLDQFAARRLTADIRNALAVADDLLARAYTGRVWLALGHKDWRTYCAAELPELRTLKMRAEPRLARVALLVAAGASVSDVQAATGASRGQAHADIKTLTAVEPAAPVAVVPLTDRIVELLAKHPGGLSVFDIAKRLKVRQAQVSPALTRMNGRRITYLAPARRGMTGLYTIEGV